MGWGGRTLNSSGHFERRGELLDEDVGDDGREEDPETVGKDPVDDERVPVVVASLAPAAAVVLPSEHKASDECESVCLPSLVRRIYLR